MLPGTRRLPRRLGAGTVVLALAVLLPLALPGQTQSASPSIDLDQDQGFPGDAVGVTGSGFQQSVECTLHVLTGQEQPDDSNQEGTCQIEQSGDLSGSFTVPDRSPGGYDVLACNNIQGQLCAEAALHSFEILDPNSTTTTTTTTTSTTTTTTTTTSTTPTTTTSTTTTTTPTTTTSSTTTTTTTVPEDEEEPDDAEPLSLPQPDRLTDPLPGLTVDVHPDGFDAGVMGGPATVLPLGEHIGVPPEGFRPRCRPPEHARILDFDDLDPGSDAREAYADQGVHFDVGRTSSGTFEEDDRPLTVERATAHGTISEPNNVLVESVDRDSDSVRIRFDSPQRLIGVYTGEPDDWARMQVNLKDLRELPEGVEPRVDIVSQSGRTPITTCMLLRLPEGEATQQVELRTAYVRSNLRFDRLFFSEDSSYRVADVTEGFVLLTNPSTADEIDVSGPISLTGTAGPRARPGDDVERYVDTVRITYTGASGTRYHSVEAEVELPEEGRRASSWRLDNVRLPLGTTRIAMTATGPGVVATDTAEITGTTPTEELAEAEGTFDIVPVGIEVNQGITDVVLPADPGDRLTDRPRPQKVEGRSTVVRVYGTVDWDEEGPPMGTESIPVEAKLFGFREGRLLPGSPLVANPVAIPLSERWDVLPPTFDQLGELRDERTTSWNFTLPLSWTEGEIDLYAWVNPLGPGHWTELEGAAGDLNTLRLDGVDFHQVDARPVHLVLVDYHWRRGGPVQSALVDTTTLVEQLDRWERMFPVPYEGLPIGGYTVKQWAERPCPSTFLPSWLADLLGDPDYDCSEPAVPDMQVWDNAILHAELADWIERRDQVYVPTLFNPSTPIGCSGRAGYTTPLFHAGVCAATIAQEAAHSNTLIHVSNAHGEVTGGAFYERFPDDHGELENLTAGWDPGTGQPVPGDGTHGFMSYGSAPTWVTLATWDDLVTRLQSTNPGAAAPAVGRLVALQTDTEADGALVVSGVLHPDGRDVGADLTQSPEITSVISIDTLPDIPPPTEATHRLVLVAPDGDELASRGFAVARPTHAGLPVEFHQYLPAVAGAAAVELHHDGEVVASASLDEMLSTLSDLDTGTLEGTPPWGELLPVIRSPGLDRLVRPTGSIRFDAQVAGGLTADMEVSWLLDGESAGDTPTLFLAGLDEGAHQLTLQVADDDREGETVVAFTVGADADGDGLWDTWEAEVGLDPTDPSDASTDSDGDRLLAWQEQAAGSHPARLDTDGDGYSDTVELDGASDPADSDSVPQALHGAFGGPVPMVGSDPSSPTSSNTLLLTVAIGAGLLVAGGGWWLLRRRQRTG